MNETQSQSAVSEDCSNPPVLGHQGAVTPVSNGFVGFAGSTNSVIGFLIVAIKVKARGHLGYEVTHAFLDSGSNSTFCTEELLKQLNLEGEETSLSLSTIKKENSRLECQVVSPASFTSRYSKAGGHCEMASSSRNLFTPRGRSSWLANQQRQCNSP